MTDQPKPCPFCGSPLATVRGRCIECRGCGASGPELPLGRSPDEMVRQWNSRALAPQTGQCHTSQLREMNDDLLAILGKPNFVCGPIAHLMKAAGVVNMRPKSEDEQAHVLLWLLRLYLDHGREWANVASLQIGEWQKLLAAKRAGVANG